MKISMYALHGRSMSAAKPVKAGPTNSVTKAKTESAGAIVPISIVAVRRRSWAFFVIFFGSKPNTVFETWVANKDLS